MTPEICASASEGDTKQLIDWRDGKTYWVAKLKDGNCWMTQNLELDLSTDTPLTSELSDVANSWTPTSNTCTSAQDGTYDIMLVQSYNLGKYVWKAPDNTGGCGNSGVYDFSNSKCQSYWQDVSSWTPMAQYRTDGVTYDVDSQTYDAHYLAGNYYSLQAATAGTSRSGAPSNNYRAPDSICPKGFELPISDPNNSNGSFYHLLNQYNLTNASISGDNNIVKAPLFFVRGGTVVPGSYLYNAGAAGFYKSSSIYRASYDSNYYSRYLYFFSGDAGAVWPSSSEPTDVGQSVRCVAPSAQSAQRAGCQLVGGGGWRTHKINPKKTTKNAIKVVFACQAGLLHKLRKFSQIYRFYACGDIILPKNEQKWPILAIFGPILCMWCIK